MPTREEFLELVSGEKCNCIWTTDYNGVKGILCTGKEGTEYAYNSVFFPAAGTTQLSSTMKASRVTIGHLHHHTCSITTIAL